MPNKTKKIVKRKQNVKVYSLKRNLLRKKNYQFVQFYFRKIFSDRDTPAKNPLWRLGNRSLDALKLYPANIYLFKANNRNTRKRCEICSKLTTKTPERCHWRRSGVFIVNFEHVFYLFLVFLLLTLKK